MRAIFIAEGPAMIFGVALFGWLTWGMPFVQGVLFIPALILIAAGWMMTYDGLFGHWGASNQESKP